MAYSCIMDVMNLVVFLIEQQRYALPLASVVCIVSAAEITPLPNTTNTPAGMLGVIDFRGELMPVLSLRQRFNLAERAVGVQHHFLIAITQKRKVAIFIDAAQEVIAIDASLLVEADQIAFDAGQWQGLVKLDGELVLIYDLEKFLSPSDEKLLDAALGELT